MALFLPLRMIETYEQRGIQLDRMIYWEAKQAMGSEVRWPCGVWHVAPGFASMSLRYNFALSQTILYVAMLAFTETHAFLCHLHPGLQGRTSTPLPQLYPLQLPSSSQP